MAICRRDYRGVSIMALVYRSCCFEQLPPPLALESRSLVDRPWSKAYSLNLTLVSYNTLAEICQRALATYAPHSSSNKVGVSIIASRTA